MWPLHGSVLLHDGIAYVAVGRSSYLDGGIELYGLDPRTGAVRHSTRILSEHTGALEPPPAEKEQEMAEAISQNSTDYKTFLAADQSDAFSMRGALTDVLVADGGSIFMRHLRFDPALRRNEEKRPHLFSTASLLDGSEHNRSYWVLGTGDFSRTPVAYPWIATKRLTVPYGLMMAFDATTVWCVRRTSGKRQKIGHAIVALPRPDPADAANAAPDFQKRTAKKAAGVSWQTTLSLRPRALLRAGSTLFIGGMTGVGEKVGLEELTSRAGALHVIAAQDGSVLSRKTLAAPPVWDGMAAAGGRLYLALEDGSVVCLGG